MISINLDKAKDIHRDYLRIARQPVLESLDIQFMRALEAGNVELQKSISQQKQMLRDVPTDPRIESAQTVDELKTITLQTLAVAATQVSA